MKNAMKTSNGVKLLILTGIFPPDIGGPATQLDYLIRDLRKDGFEISVLTFGDKNNDYPYKVRKISKKIPSLFRKIFYIIAALKMSFQTRTVYAWDLYIAGFSGFLIKKIFPWKKFIVRFAGDSAWEKARGSGKISDNLTEFIEKKYGFSIEFKKWFRKRILTSADKVITVSYFLEEIAKKIGVEKSQLKMIYNSVDFLFKDFNLDVGRPSYCRQELGFKGINLITASRLVPWKGQKTLVEIMPALIEKYPPTFPHESLSNSQNNISRKGGGLFLRIIGDGPEYKNLEFKIQDLGLNKNVFLVGKLSHQELFKYLKCADIFVLNTDYEGLSHSILEAMHIGIPIITTDVCSNSELIENGKSGFLVEYDNKEQLKKTISELIEYSELGRRFAEEAKKNLEKFSWRNLVEETADVLK